jgi:uncharacterized membrane protein
MIFRKAIALLALLNALVATYLHLWKIGKAGTLSCTTGHGCETAQLSSYGWFLGVDVALIGAVGYSVLLIAALWALQPAQFEQRRPTLVLLALIIPAVVFTVRLKYGEWIVLKVFCSWCVISTVSILLGLLLAWLDWRRVGGSGSTPPERAGRLRIAA